MKKLIAALLPLMPKRLVWIFSKKYIAGKKIEEAVETSKKLNEKNMLVTFDILGEFIEDLSEAEENKNEYLELIDHVEKTDIKGNYSLKPTSFGLLLDEEVCYNNIKEIVVKAASFNNFIRIDMEDSSCVDKEIKLYSRLKKEFPNNVGLVVQAYLKRTLADLQQINTMHKDIGLDNYRLCKGIYIEDKSIAYKDYDEVNNHYLEDLEYLFANNIYVGIATHDKVLVDGAYKLIEKYNKKKDEYEFQMLYGVTPGLRQSIVDKGHRLRVYIPYGEKWFAYSTRRLKENPNMVNHIIKAMFKKG